MDLHKEFESLRFAGPGAERTLQFADPDAKLIGAAALPGELSPHCFGLGGFAAQSITQLLVLFVITSDVIPQELGLRLQRRELALEWGDIVGGSIFLGFEREQRRGLFAELELEFGRLPRFSCLSRRPGWRSWLSSARSSVRAGSPTWRIRRVADPYRPEFLPSISVSAPPDDAA